jgi:long-chain acyl-CoA synthetase
MYNSAMSFWPARALETVTTDGLRIYEDQPSTLPELIWRSVLRRGGEPAAGDVGGRRLTYAELWEETERVAAGLQRQHGVGRGDHVVFFASNSLDLLVGVIATWRAGAVAVMLNAKYTAAEVERQLSLCAPRVVLTEPAARSRLTRPAHLLGSTSEQGFEPPDLRPTDPALLMFTSGTTGASRAAIQSHLNLVSAAETWVRCLDLQPHDSTVVAAPMYHVTGLNGQSLPVLAAGGAVEIMSRFDARALVERLEGGRASFFHAAPTSYTLALMAAGSRRARGLRVCVSGGAFVGRGLVQATQRFAPGSDVRISYGMTETSSPAVLTPNGWIDDRPGNAVGVAVPVDDVSVDDDGEILFRGATVITGSEWLRSGDLGTIDADGFITVIDRIKDIVNRGGEKIASLEVEDVICSHPGVVEAAVVSRPDVVYGEVPYAFVAGDVDVESLRAYVAERLARFKVPVGFEIIERLPRNPAGKVVKAELRAGTRHGLRGKMTPRPRPRLSV